MSTQAQQQNPWARELDDIMRGASGGFLFSIPLLFTMEVWWIGTAISPPRMAVALLSACVIVFLLTLTGGFRKEEHGKLSDAFIETVQGIGFSLLFSAAVMVLLRRVSLATPLDEAVGTVIYGALPFAVGMSLGNELLGGAADEEGDDAQEGQEDRPRGVAPAEGDDERSATLKDLAASAIGAIFIAFSIAPTEEIPMLAAALSPPWLLAMIAASLLISYMIVFESGFADEEGRRQQHGVLQSPASETVASYLVALVAAALMLILYAQVRFDDPWHVWLSHTIVLGLPAAVGGAAGRLAV